MKNLKSIKRALLCSVLALVLCFTMLLGTTFAWFTDSVTSANNKIIAGDLNIDLKLWNGTGENDFVEITNESKPIFGGADSLTQDTVWEPGKTEVVYLSLKNSGSLDLKYKVAIDVKNPLDGKDLYKVMEYAVIPDAKFDTVTAWTSGVDVVLGNNATQANNVILKSTEEHFFALAVHMDENAGNEYMNGSVEFDIKVFAAQAVSESDSFGNTYDELATYDDGMFLIQNTTVTATATAGETVTAATEDNTFKATATAGDTGTVTATIANVNATDSVFEVVGSSGKSLLSYDIDVTGQADGSDVTVELFIGKNLMGIEVFHDGNLMTAGTDYSYNPTTGVITITTDSFSPFEIAFRPAGDIPVAKVVLLNEYPEELDVAYMFSTTEILPEPEGDNGEYTDEQVDAFLEKIAPYTFWHADFVISLDKDIDAEQIILGGQYDAWSENWVYPIYNPNPIAVGEEIRLLQFASEMMGKQGLDQIFINYAELCAYVQNFKCGVGAAEDADLAGTTITVELRLYETYSAEEAIEKFGNNSTNYETGDYVTIATYPYTFK